GQRAMLVVAVVGVVFPVYAVKAGGYIRQPVFGVIAVTVIESVRLPRLIGHMIHLATDEVITVHQFLPAIIRASHNALLVILYQGIYVAVNIIAVVCTGGIF